MPPEVVPTLLTAYAVYFAVLAAFEGFLLFTTRRAKR